jgi:hypothetical protein
LISGRLAIIKLPLPALPHRQADEESPLPDNLEAGHVRSHFGTHIPLSEKFYNSVCMFPEIGLYFHHPVGYPTGTKGGWKHVLRLPLNAAWAWVQTVAPNVEFNHYGVVTARPETPTFGELRERDPRTLWPDNMAIVVKVDEDEILALYHDPEHAEDSPFSYCVISLRP